MCAFSPNPKAIPNLNRLINGCLEFAPENAIYTEKKEFNQLRSLRLLGQCKVTILIRKQEQLSLKRRKKVKT